MHTISMTGEMVLSCQCTVMHKHKHRNSKAGYHFSDSWKCDRYALGTGPIEERHQKIAVVFSHKRLTSTASSIAGDELKSKVHCASQTALEPVKLLEKMQTEGDGTGSGEGAPPYKWARIRAFENQKSLCSLSWVSDF